MSDILHDFIEENRNEFSGDDGVTLRRAFELWNQFRRESDLGVTLAMHKFREELSAYFEVFKVRETVNGVVVRSFFSGLKPPTVS